MVSNREEDIARSRQEAGNDAFLYRDIEVTKKSWNKCLARGRQRGHENGDNTSMKAHEALLWYE